MRKLDSFHSGAAYSAVARQMATDLLAHFSWGEFGLAAALYTLLPFLSRSPTANTTASLQLIAKLKSDPKTVLGIHLGFLSLLFGILWESAQIYTSLPDWMTGQNSVLSIFDLAVCIFGIVMVIVEQRMILKCSSVWGSED